MTSSIRKLTMMYLIGAGGIGCYLAPGLSRIAHPSDSVCIYDGDLVEKKNLTRQMYTSDDIGKPKANILASRYGFSVNPFWFDENATVREKSVIFCAADNVPCRKDVLTVADKSDCIAIIGGNETWSSEAYIYFPQWKGSEYDPRTYYPTILTDETGRPSADCHSDESVAKNPQTVTANMMAAALMLKLFFCWANEKGRLLPGYSDGKTRPVHIRSERFIMSDMLTKSSKQKKGDRAT